MVYVDTAIWLDLLFLMIGVRIRPMRPLDTSFGASVRICMLKADRNKNYVNQKYSRKGCHRRRRTENATKAGWEVSSVELQQRNIAGSQTVDPSPVSSRFLSDSAKISSCLRSHLC